MKSLMLFAAGFLLVIASVNSEAASQKCPKGQIWDPGMKMCMPAPKPRNPPVPKCAKNQHWDAKMKMCMPDKNVAFALSGLSDPTIVSTDILDTPEVAAKKCPVGQFYDAAMKMCMPTAKTGDPATFAMLSKKVFSQQCTTCHMVMGPKDPAEAGIDLSSFAAFTASNDSKTNPKHAPFIVAGDPEHSKLYVAVKTGKMPRNEDGTPAPALSAADVQDIYDWINQGALNN